MVFGRWSVECPNDPKFSEDSLLVRFLYLVIARIRSGVSRVAMDTKFPSADRILVKISGGLHLLLVGVVPA